jgi:DNA modification methylase
MARMDARSVDVILTSPFYNTNKKAGKTRTLENTFVKGGKYNYVRYDMHVDNMTNDEYCAYTVNLFTNFDKILQNGGGAFCTTFHMVQRTRKACSAQSTQLSAIRRLQLPT